MKTPQLKLKKKIVCYLNAEKSTFSGEQKRTSIVTYTEILTSGIIKN